MANNNHESTSAVPEVKNTTLLPSACEESPPVINIDDTELDSLFNIGNQSPYEGNLENPINSFERFLQDFALKREEDEVEDPTVKSGPVNNDNTRNYHPHDNTSMPMDCTIRGSDGEGAGSSRVETTFARSDIAGQKNQDVAHHSRIQFSETSKDNSMGISPHKKHSNDIQPFSGNSSTTQDLKCQTTQQQENPVPNTSETSFPIVNTLNISRPNFDLNTMKVKCETSEMSSNCTMKSHKQFESILGSLHDFFKAMENARLNLSQKIGDTGLCLTDRIDEEALNSYVDNAFAVKRLWKHYFPIFLPLKERLAKECSALVHDFDSFFTGIEGNFQTSLTDTRPSESTDLNVRNSSMCNNTRDTVQMCERTVRSTNCRQEGPSAKLKLGGISDKLCKRPTTNRENICTDIKEERKLPEHQEFVPQKRRRTSVREVLKKEGRGQRQNIGNVSYERPGTSHGNIESSRPSSSLNYMYDTCKNSTPNIHSINDKLNSIQERQYMFPERMTNLLPHMARSMQNLSTCHQSHDSSMHNTMSRHMHYPPTFQGVRPCVRHTHPNTPTAAQFATIPLQMPQSYENQYSQSYPYYHNTRNMQ